MIMRQEDGSFRGVAWNSSRHRTGRKLELSFEIDCRAGDDRPYFLLTETVDENTCNPLKLWHDMGEPKHLMPEQKALLQEAARPAIASRRLEVTQEGEACVLELLLPVEEFGVVYFELKPVCEGGDRGYDYDRVRG